MKAINKLICFVSLMVAIGAAGNDNFGLALLLAAYPVIVLLASFVDSVRRWGL